MDGSQIRFDTLLTRVSVGYKNEEYVAGKVFPEIPVDFQAQKYLKASKDTLRPVNDLRAPGGVADEINWNLSSDPYYCDGHALKTVIPDEWRQAQGGIDLDTDSTEQLTEKISLVQEVNLVSALVAGMVASSQAAKPWDNDANDPIPVIEAAKETTTKAVGRRPNVMVFSRPVFRAVRNNAKILSRITGAADLRSSSVTAQQLAELLELDEVIVASAIKLTSNEGAADVSDFVWGKLALLFVRPKNPGPRTVSLGYTFTWNVGVRGRAVRRYRIDERTADVIEAQKYYDQKIVVADAGTLFTDTIA